MSEQKKKRRIADFQPELLDVAEWVKSEDIIDKEVEVLEVQERDGNKGEYLCMAIQIEGTKKRLGFNCGGKVVVKKIKTAVEEGKLPLWMTLFYPDGKDYLDIK